MSGIGGHTRQYRGRSDEWLTPPEILRALGPFDLDPAAPIDRPWPMAAEHLTVLEDGLSRAWRGRVWLNPPYGPQTRRWLRKLAHHGNGIALTFARTETRMFFESVWPCATALLFLRGRPRFYRPDGTQGPWTSGGPVVLIAYGAENARALERCGLAGAVLPLGAAPRGREEG